MNCLVPPFLLFFVLDCIVNWNWGFDRKNAAVNKTEMVNINKSFFCVITLKVIAVCFCLSILH